MMLQIIALVLLTANVIIAMVLWYKLYFFELGSKTKKTINSNGSVKTVTTTGLIIPRYKWQTVLEKYCGQDTEQDK